MSVRESTERKLSEEKMTENSKILEVFFSHILSPVAVLDRDFNFIRVNAAYARADNRDVSDFPGNNHFDFYPSDAREIFEEVVRTKKTYQVYARPFEYKDHPERGITYWDWTLVPVLDKDGEVELLIFSLMDVTLSARARKEIEKLASIVESTDDAIIGITLDGIIATWNSGADRLYGYLAGEVVGQPVHLLSEGAPKRIELALDKMRQGIRVESYEAAHKRKDGKEVSVSVTVSPVRDIRGVISGVSIIARDITEQKKMSDELDKLHHHLVDILESMSDAFIALDQNWRFVYLNRVAENIAQSRRETLIGKNIWEVFPEAVGTRQFYMYKTVMEERTAVNFELPEIFPGRVLDVFAYPSPDGISIFYKDVTSRRKLEKEMSRLDRLNIVGQMAAGIGHEIRNPMTAIRGFLQILSSKKPCQQYSNYFDIMIGELDRANAIISEFLSMAKNKNEEMRRINLNIIVEAIFPLIEAQARNSNKDIINGLGDVPDLLLNEKEIRQLILNLTRNGLESMEVGGKLLIKTYLEGGEVVLAVKDQGRGIDDKVLEKIGTPFFTTKESGTGLGLATCYSIAARHNAEIGFETGPEGTTFIVRFGI